MTSDLFALLIRIMVISKRDAELRKVFPFLLKGTDDNNRRGKMSDKIKKGVGKNKKKQDFTKKHFSFYREVI